MVEHPGHETPANDDEEDMLRFLQEEGMEALAAYRSIRSPTVRAQFVKLMQEAANAERESQLGLN